MVITEKPHNQKAWRSILGNAGFKFIEVLAFVDADQHFAHNSDQADPILMIVDVDFMDLDQLDLGVTSSDDAVAYLRKQYPRLTNIPTLSVNDIRFKRSHQNSTSSENSLLVTHSELLSEPTDNPTTVNALQGHLCKTPATIVKPFKNSALFSTLHKMTDTRDASTDNEVLNVPSTTTNSSDHHQRYLSTEDDYSNRRFSTNSSDGMERKYSTASSSISQTTTLAPSRSSSFSSFPSSPIKSEFTKVRQNSGDESLANVNALLVDDNPVNRKVLSRMLGRAGLTCKTANDGQEACDVIRNARDELDKPYDLVFMDIWMPKMNGLEACTIIRRELSDSEVKPYIIAMTACVMSGDRDKCFEAGKNGVLSH